MDIEFDDLIIKVFNDNPQPVKTYMVSFDVSNLEKLYELLIEFFYKGLNIKYGNNIVNLSDEKFIEMNSYMKSIGIIVHHEKYTNCDFMHNFKIYKDINSNNLEDYKYYFLINGVYYIIYFTLL